MDTVVFKKRPLLTAAYFVEMLEEKGLGCDDVFSEQHTESIFAEGLPLNVRENMHRC